MRCIIDQFKYTVGSWIKYSNPEKPGKMKLFKVIAENNFHQSNQPASFMCGCNYKLASKANLSGKGKPVILSSQPIRTVQWKVYLDSKSLDPAKLKILKPDQADKAEREIQSKTKKSSR